VALIRFIAELDGTGVLALFRSPARRPRLVLVGIQLALVLLAAALISISGSWAAVAWEAAGFLFAGLMILSVRTITRNLARQAKPARSPAADSAPGPSPRICARPSPRICAYPSPQFCVRPSPRICAYLSPQFCVRPSPRIRAGPRRRICAVTASPAGPRPI
jgi:hypothetical protein